MSRRFPPNGEPPDDWPPPPPPPKSAIPKPSDATSLISENSVALPIAYGTVRTPALLIERYAYAFAGTDQGRRLPSTTYAVGDIRQNAGNLYVVSAQTSASGTGDGPSGTGSGQTDGGVTWDYIKMGYRHFVAMAFCEGLIYGGGKAWQDKNVFADYYTGIPHDSSWIGLNLGNSAGTPLRGGIQFPAQTSIYTNTAVLWSLLSTGSDADLPDISIEIKGIFADATHVDANPADIAIDLLTHARRGAQWPSARVDAVSTGSGAASWRTYCTAAGFVMSWLIDQQTSAKSLISQLVAITNTDAVWTNRIDGLGFMLKFVPLGTDSITANGVTFTPNLTPAYALTESDYLSTITIDIVPPTETFNSFPVEYVDRATDYKRITVDDTDMSDVDVRGLVRASTSAIPMVISPDAAISLSRIKAQRSLNIRNTYRAKLGWRFILLEPTDLVTFTEPDLGLVSVPARVTVFEEDQASGEITITCEDFPAAVGAAKSYTPQANDGFKPTVPTALGALKVLPGQASKSVVADSSSTRGAAVDNLWPNFNSEIDPPDGVDTTTAEWASRTLDVGGAYSGKWVRMLGPGAFAEMYLDVPAAPGETYYLEAQIKAVVAGASKGGTLEILALDSTDTLLAFNTGATNDTTSWAKSTATVLCPASTTKVRLKLKTGGNAAANAKFDSIYARRAVSGQIIGDGTAWFTQFWAAVANVDLNGGSLVVNNSVNIASYGAGATYNTKASVRLTWSTPPAAFAPGGSIYPLVTAQAAYGGNISGRRLVPVGLIGSPPTAVDLQLFESNGSSTAPVVLTGLEVFHVHILFIPSTPGFAL